MPLPSNANRVIVRFTWLNSKTGKGEPKKVTFDPVPLSGSTAPNVTDLAAFAWIKTQQEVVVPNADSGYGAVPLLTNDDPDLTAFGGWRVTPEGEPPFVIAVSVDSPTVSVDAAMKAAIPDLVLGEQVQAMWLTEAALVDTVPPAPPTAWLTASQTVSTIASAVENHDGDGGAHPDIRALIGSGGGGLSQQDLDDAIDGLPFRSDNVDQTGAEVGGLSALRRSQDGSTFALETITPDAETKKRVRTLLGRLGLKSPVAVHPDPPTITYGTTTTYTTGRPWQASPAHVTLLGVPVSFSAGPLRTVTDASTVGMDFYLDGNGIEIWWTSSTSNDELLWVFVDGQPLTAAPALGTSTTTGISYYMKLAFPSSTRRRITVYAGRIAGWPAMRTAVSSAVLPAPRGAKIAVVGDSFADYAGAIRNAINSFPLTLARALGAEVVQAGTGGTGYNTGGANSFGGATRVAKVAEANPDVIVILGSVNDPESGLAAAVTAAYAAYAAALPNTPIIVIGPQPTNATDTISAARQSQNATVKAAALAAPNVIGYHDMIGHADGLPPAWNSGATYNDGDLVTNLGSVWRFSNGGTAGNATGPGSSPRWVLLTWSLTGTGQIGTTAGDGTRDTLLYSDGVHWSQAGADQLGLRAAAAVMSTLLAAAA